MSLFWLSFADTQKFRGVCIVDAIDPGTALASTILTGINPGPDTSVKIMECEKVRSKIPKKFIGKLLDKKKTEQVVKMIDD